MPTNILLVRHGQTKSNFSGYYTGWGEEDLDPIGFEQAQRISVRLAELPVKAVYSSPLQRTQSTAKIIAGPHHLEVTPVDDLIEINFGHWQGLHVNDIRQQWPEIFHTWQSTPSEAAIPGGESFSQTAERAIRAFEKIRAENPQTLAVIVSHDIILKIIIMSVLRADFSIYRRFEVYNASLSIIQARGDHLRVVTVNDKSHLEGLDFKG